MWDSWLRMDSLKAFGRAFGKPSSLFIASWPLVLRRPVELALQSLPICCITESDEGGQSRVIKLTASTTNALHYVILGTVR